jgi:hypothetical protein
MSILTQSSRKQIFFLLKRGVANKVLLYVMLFISFMTYKVANTPPPRTK